eukprot:403343345
MTAYAYDDKYGFLGNGLFDPQFRSKGYCSEIFEYCRDTLGHRQIGGDGVMYMMEAFRRWGFTDYHFINTFQYVVQPKLLINVQNIKDVQSEEDVNKLLKYDKEVFGFDRSKVLKLMLKSQSDVEFKIAFDKDLIGNESVVGYGLIRKTLDQDWFVGPLIANNEDIARDLFQALVQDKQNQQIHLISEEISTKTAKLVEKFNMKQIMEPKRRRVYINGNPNRSDYDKIYFNMSLGFN